MKFINTCYSLGKANASKCKRNRNNFLRWFEVYTLEGPPWSAYWRFEWCLKAMPKLPPAAPRAQLMCLQMCFLENFKQTRMSTTHMYEAACANTFTQRALIHETHFVPQHQCNSSDCTHSSFISFNP